MSTREPKPSAASTLGLTPEEEKALLCSPEEWAETLAEQRREEIEEGKKYRKGKDGKPVMVVHQPVDL